MPFEHDAAECIEDILENIAKIEGYLTGLTREMFENDDRTRDAAERCLERICEAVFRLGARAEQLMPGQPSSAIRGMGNWFRHGYDSIDLDTVDYGPGSASPSKRTPNACSVLPGARRNDEDTRAAARRRRLTRRTSRIAPAEAAVYIAKASR